MCGAYPHVLNPCQGAKVALLASAPRARPARGHPRAPVPARAALGQRRAAADGPAARPAGAGRVLGLLPRQLAADAALPLGLARALRRRRPARDRHPHRRLPARARSRRRRRGRRAARHRVPGRHRRAAGAVGLLRQRGLARALPLGRAAGRSTRCTTARAPTRRPSARSRRCSGSSASSCRPCAPRTPPASSCRPRRPTSPAPTPGPTRRAACGRCSRAAARCGSTAARSPSTGPARTRWWSTRATRARVLELEIGDGVTCHATCFTPGLP